MNRKFQVASLSILAAAILSLPAAALFNYSDKLPLRGRVNIAQGRGLERAIYVDTPRMRGQLWLTLFKRSAPSGLRIAHYGPYRNLIVNAGETALRDCFIATSCTATQNFKFHGLGTGTTNPAEGDTSCETELSTAYNPDNTRATGSQTNNGANVYRTVGTNTLDGAAAVTEWCLMTQAATGGGTMWSRIEFTVINLAASDSLQTTYDLTIE